MRLLHTSDWHLGRLFHGVHLTGDQAHVLFQLLDVVRDAKPDAVLIAGDVYDRAVPPPEAVQLLDELLTRLVLDLRTPVVAIAGNHDSGDRLGFGARLLAERGLHVAGAPVWPPRAIELADARGAVDVVALPYAEAGAVRALSGDEAVRDHAAAVRCATEAARAACAAGRRSVLVAHAFVGGGLASESERPLSVGGADAADAAAFAGFSYVALGHLHRAQAVGDERLRYSGSPLKYSFSEAGHRKSVSLIELDARGACAVEVLPLSPRRDVRVLRGELREILAGPASGESREDYVCAELTDRAPILDAIGRIREVYPNCLHVDRSAYFAAALGADESRARVDHRRQSEVELFRAFFAETAGEAPSEAEIAAFTEAALRVRRREDRGDDPAAPASDLRATPTVPGPGAPHAARRTRAASASGGTDG